MTLLFITTYYLESFIGSVELGVGFLHESGPELIPTLPPVQDHGAIGSRGHRIKGPWDQGIIGARDPYYS